MKKKEEGEEEEEEEEEDGESWRKKWNRSGSRNNPHGPEKSEEQGSSADFSLRFNDHSIRLKLTKWTKLAKGRMHSSEAMIRIFRIPGWVTQSGTIASPAFICFFRFLYHLLIIIDWIIIHSMRFLF